MWMRFTERARRVILLGQEEAGKMNSPHVGTEHLFLGLVRDNDSVAKQILGKMGITYQIVLHEIHEELGDSQAKASAEPKLTPRAKRVLELAADEARRMRHSYIGTEHLLLALIREEGGVAANVLRKLGLSLEKARQQVLEYLGPENEDVKRPSRHVFELSETQEAKEIARQHRAKRMESLDWMLPMLTGLLPRELREMGKQLRSLNKQKEIAVLQDDYETAAIFRDEANILEKRMEAFAVAWEEKMNEESWDSSHETLSFVVHSLISTVEAAIEALSAGDEAKIAEIKMRLQLLLASIRPQETADEQPDDKEDAKDNSVEET
jgi:ATP-dependent Clp protease ATP-binding subunit ClpA